MGWSRNVVARGRRCALAAATLTVGALPCGAQTLRGTILERGSERPIPLARTVLLSATGDSLAFALTDSAGGFSLSSSEPGDFLLLTSAMGYRTSRAGVFELGPGGALTLEVRLTLAPLAIEGLRVELPLAEPRLVESGFLERLTTGLGHFLTPKDLEQTGGRLLADRLAMIPGVRVRADTVFVFRHGRPCVPRIYLDGAPAWGIRGDIGMLVGIEDVEAVEIYQGVTETPFRFGGATGDPCGAIVIWTKRR